MMIHHVGYLFVILFLCFFSAAAVLNDAANTHGSTPSRRYVSSSDTTEVAKRYADPSPTLERLYGDVPGRYIAPSRLDRSHQASRPRQAIPSRQHSPRQAAPSRVRTPRQAAPSRVHTPRQATPSRAHTPRQAVPSQVHTPRQAAPSQVHTPRQAVPSQVHTPRQAVPSRVHTARQAVPSRVHTPRQAVPSQAHTPRQAAPSQVHTNRQVDPSPQHTPRQDVSSHKYARQVISSEGVGARQAAPSQRHPGKRDVPVDPNPHVPSPSQALRKRSKVAPQVPMLPSPNVCPAGLSACAIQESGLHLGAESVEYECVDFMTDLDHCGGCSSQDFDRFNCRADPHASSVACVSGGCVTTSCQPGYTLQKGHQLCAPI
ncbi:hypothetical protein PISMIDRAFT_671445 [Pisolithus microcarpus 441]|uniref:Protein CPL1-like domain-containing protein n=1 Tax=Pisolithus microcarpus 441 TaxID=765257 RepID=A0A0D0ADV4_9AGAM|nr:hypothetical protein BKA83DRAFT_671445 [Pisolithus microcarpus]KIK30273.1 hypothetical protein PISMIDRAFT_671445 [Pisolithus microcarpus 441]